MFSDGHLELRKPFQCGHRGWDPIKGRISKVAPLKGEALVWSIMDGFIPMLDRELAPDNLNDHWQALEEIIIYYMALLCPDCRQKLAEKLRDGIPNMLTRASQIAPDVREQFGEFHLY